MATTVKLANIEEGFDSEGRFEIRVNFADGTQHIFQSLSELLAWAREVDMDKLLVEKMCVAYAAARSPDLSNINTVKGKNFTFDLSAPQPIRVQ